VKKPRKAARRVGMTCPSCRKHKLKRFAGGFILCPDSGCPGYLGPVENPFDVHSKPVKSARKEQK
jgi:ribosomal protein L37AE/L43A